MRKFSWMALGLSVVLGFAVRAAAHEVKYETFMNGANENPANPSLGTGYSLVTIDLDVLTMRVQAEFSGLNGTTQLAHIHCCVTTPGGNVGFATTAPSFPGFPLGVTSGTYDQTFDLTQASSYNPSFITANTNIDGALNKLLEGFANGTAYFNIHTSFRTGGEIRGFFAFVPEPGSCVLAMLGATGLFLRRRR